MTGAETRSLAWAGAVLLVASAVRYAAELRPGEPLFPPDSAGVLPTLLDESRAAREEAERRRRPLAEGERIDPNRAPEEELDRLPGVGPSAARAIVQERERGGPFLGPEDLTRVRGVGPGTVARMAPHLEFGRDLPILVRGGLPGGGAPAAQGTATGATVAQGGLTAPTHRSPVDLNRATAAELQRLPGIGPALALRILEEREKRGRFSGVEDLLSVRGIGPATLERLRPLIVAGR